MGGWGGGSVCTAVITRKGRLESAFWKGRCARDRGLSPGNAKPSMTAF